VGRSSSPAAQPGKLGSPASDLAELCELADLSELAESANREQREESGKKSAEGEGQKAERERSPAGWGMAAAGWLAGWLVHC